ncbi:MAG: TatD family hydrolase [Deltaproteobacteria bacterium]
MSAMVVPGVEPARWALTAAMALPGERYVALGIHPQCLPDLSDTTVADGLADLPGRLRACGAVAVGECGLDGLIDLAVAPMERQCAVLEAHVETARALELPLILHVLRAHDDALRVLRRVRLPRRPGVMHSFSGSPDLARQYLALGFYLSFAGAVTRPNARRPVESARITPADRLLVETDAPDQTPVGAPPSGPDGRRCEPAHLGITLARLAVIRSEDPVEIAGRTARNACMLFGLTHA